MRRVEVAGVRSSAPRLRRAARAPTWGLAWATSLLFLLAEVEAQPSALAQDLFERGVAAMRAGDYASGCPALAESERLEPLPGTLFTLAECEARAGLVASAWAHFGSYLDRVRSLTEAERARQADRVAAAEQRRLELEPQVPRLTVMVSDDTPSDTELAVGGVTLGSLDAGRSVPVDPGEVRVTLAAADGRRAELTVALSAGERREVLLALPPGPAPAPSTSASAPPPAAPPASAVPPAPSASTAAREPPPDVATPRHSRGRRAATFTAFGVAGAGAAVGAVGAVSLLARKSTIETHCDGPSCDAEGYEASQAIAGLDALANVGFAVAGVGVTAGLVLALAPARRGPTTEVGRPRLRVDARGVRLEGRF